MILKYPQYFTVQMICISLHSYKQKTAKQPRGWEVVTEFQIKVKQVNFALHSKKQFTGGNSLKQYSYFRRETVSGQHPLQWAHDINQGS